MRIETNPYDYPAVIGIMCFAMASIRSSPPYNRVPMGIIGKVYANSMLVLNNSRMLLGSTEEKPLTIMSGLRFGGPALSGEDDITEAHHGAFSVDSEEMTGFSRSGPES
jgi:hypothetical protein